MSPSSPESQTRIARVRAKIDQQHRDLAKLRDQISTTVQGGDLEAVRHAINEFSGVLEAHFELEEHAYYPGPDGMSSGTRGRFHQLKGDHTRLREDLERLRDESKREDPSELSRLFSDFVNDLRDHEAREEWTLAQLDPS